MLIVSLAFSPLFRTRPSGYRIPSKANQSLGHSYCTGVDHKPNSVSRKRSGWRSFILFPDHSGNPAVYPKASDGPSLIPEGIAFLFDLAPCGVFRAAAVASSAVRSYRTFSPLPHQRQGGVFSVALSVGSPLPRVMRRTALRSSDFPRSRKQDRDRLLNSSTTAIL